MSIHDDMAALDHLLVRYNELRDFAQIWSFGMVTVDTLFGELHSLRDELAAEDGTLKQVQQAVGTLTAGATQQSVDALAQAVTAMQQSMSTVLTQLVSISTRLDDIESKLGTGTLPPTPSPAP